MPIKRIICFFGQYKGIWQRKSNPEDIVLVFKIEYDNEEKENVVFFINNVDVDTETNKITLDESDWDHLYRKAFVRGYKYTGVHVRIIWKN